MMKRKAAGDGWKGWGDLLQMLLPERDQSISCCVLLETPFVAAAVLSCQCVSNVAN